MKIKEALEILKKEGYDEKIIYNATEIREVQSIPEGSYYFLINEVDTWRFGCLSMERGINEEKTIGIYQSLNEGVNGFFLFMLHGCFSQYISKEVNKNIIIEKLIDRVLILDDLLKALNHCNIPETYLSTQLVINHSIRMFEDNGLWRLEYIDSYGKRHKTTIPLSLSECIHISFKRIMYLFLLDNVTVKYFDGKKSYEYFTPEEIAAYIG